MLHMLLLPCLPLIDPLCMLCPLCLLCLHCPASLCGQVKGTALCSNAVQAIEERVAAATHLHTSHHEDLQVLRWVMGGRMGGQKGAL